MSVLCKPAAWRVGTWLVLLILSGSGCSTTVPFDYPKVESFAVEPGEQTALGQAAELWNAEHGGESGFYFLYDGMDALGARLRLIEEAERSIDMQYFLVKQDLAGVLVAAKLMRAADRGVRVRFLIDDIFTSTTLDPDLAFMNAHPNVEIRLFNPISRTGFQTLNLLADFDRANRRMHNKSFTVDNAFTIVGGRNLADEYFRTHPELEFADLDLLAFGPVAADVSEVFDLFWNSRLSVPVEALAGSPENVDYEAARIQLREEFDRVEGGVYREAVDTPFLRDLIEGRNSPFAAPSEVITDRPEKLRNPVGEEHQVVAGELRNLLGDARGEVLILSPYFIPGDSGVDFLRELAGRGVRVIVITNSLASTNHVAVHSGYAPYRAPLLKAGVELYELKVNALDPAVTSKTKTPLRLTLHSKAVVVDRETLFVGSLNLDPRSIDLNSEMGIVLNAPGPVGELAGEIEGDLAPFSYRLELTESDDLSWFYENGPVTEAYGHEPDTGIGRRFLSGFLGLLPLENQL